MKIKLGDVPHTGIFGWLTEEVAIDDRLKNFHVHCLGQSGSGKSKLLENVFLSLLGTSLADDSVGVSILDPSGKAVSDLLPYLVVSDYFSRPDAFSRLLYVEFADDEYFLKFNITRQSNTTEDEKTKMVIEGFKRVFFPDIKNTSMFDTMMSSGIKLLIRNNLSLYALFDIFSSKPFRTGCLAKIDPMRDHHAWSFFVNQWDKIPEGQQPIQGGAAYRRAFLIMDTPILALTLGQRENVLDFRTLIDSATNVIYDLSRVSNQDTRLTLEGMISHGYEVAALSRPSDSSLPHHFLLMDDFGEYAGSSPESLRKMLEQTRAKNFHAVMCHQNWSQADERLIGAMREAATKISFALGDPADAQTQVEALGSIDPFRIKRPAASPTGHPIYMSRDDQIGEQARALLNLPPGRCWVKLGSGATRICDTVRMRPYHCDPKKAKDSQLAPYFVDPSLIAQVKHSYYSKYYTKREDVILPIVDPRWGGPDIPPQRGHP